MNDAQQAWGLFSSSKLGSNTVYLSNLCICSCDTSSVLAFVLVVGNLSLCTVRSERQSWLGLVLEVTIIKALKNVLGLSWTDKNMYTHAMGFNLCENLNGRCDLRLTYHISKLYKVFYRVALVQCFGLGLVFLAKAIKTYQAFLHSVLHPVLDGIPQNRGAGDKIVRIGSMSILIETLFWTDKNAQQIYQAGPYPIQMRNVEAEQLGPLHSMGKESLRRKGKMLLVP